MKMMHDCKKEIEEMRLALEKLTEKSDVMQDKLDILIEEIDYNRVSFRDEY